MKKIALKSAAKSLLVVVLLILTACNSTVDIVHAPVGCIGQPAIPREYDFTQAEVDAMSESVYSKIRGRIIVLRERIETQCRANQMHDSLHDEVK
jgi:hypothetical protein